MRIGVDATSWFNGRGYGRFTRELLPELVAAGARHEFVVLVEEMNAPRLTLPGANVRVRPVACREAPSRAAAADGWRSPRDLLRFRRAAKSERPDVFFFPTVYSWFPLPRRLRAVVTVHDAIPERHPELTLPGWRARLFWRMKVRLALRHARLVLTVSEFSAADISKRLRVSRERLRVAVEAPSAAFRSGATQAEIASAASSTGLPPDARWLTYVGGFNPHKRVDVLLGAHGRLVAGLGAPVHLLLVGSLDGDVFHGCREELEDIVRRAGTGALVHWTGYVDDARLRALHAGALASVLPSECEGFGLPAVEAAACGAPVVATRESPLPQLLAGAGIFVPPGDEAALFDALRTVATDEAARESMRRRGPELTARLSWRRTAEDTLDALEEAAA